MKKLTLPDMERAFGYMGDYLVQRKTLGEIALYGGSAIMFQFEWRQSSQDVDAVVISDGNHGLVREAVNYAAKKMDLENSWLSDNVSVYASTSAQEKDFKYAGMYPQNGKPGLRVIAAKPEYVLAMKLVALQRSTVQDRDFQDATNLALEIGLDTQDQLRAIFGKFFPGEELSFKASERLPELEAEIARRKL